MTLYTYSEVAALLKEIAAEAPGYIYTKRPAAHGGEGCFYAWEGKADCIVGHLLERIGAMNPEECSPMRSESGKMVIPGSYEVGWSLESQISASFDDLAVLGYAFDSDAQDLLDMVQGQQDGGQPWSEAVRISVILINGHIERRQA